MFMKIAMKSAESVCTEILEHSLITLSPNRATMHWPIMDFALYCQAYMPRKLEETGICMESVPVVLL